MRMLRLIIALTIGLTPFATCALAQEAVTAAQLWYPGGAGSFWVYKADGKEITLIVIEEWFEIGGEFYKFIRENTPLWGELISNFTFFGQAAEAFNHWLNPFLVFQDKGSSLEGYGEEANRFQEDQLNKFAPKGVNVKLISPSKKWVILKNPNVKWEVKDEDATWVWKKWKVADLDISIIQPSGERTMEAGYLEGIPKGREKVETEVGEFDAFIVDYNYIKFGTWGSGRLCRVWLTDKGPAIIKVEGKVLAKLVRYEIKPSTLLPRAVTSRNRLITIWGRLKKIP